MAFQIVETSRAIVYHDFTKTVQTSKLQVSLVPVSVITIQPVYLALVSK